MTPPQEEPTDTKGAPLHAAERAMPFPAQQAPTESPDQDPYIKGYAIGCPIWANPDWVGSFFAKGTKSKDFLAAYASVFNTVEGNTTFYALPSADTILKWRDHTPEGFRFCLKFHRSITHDLKLRHADQETTHLLKIFEPLSSRLGPYLIQLPPSFGVGDLDALARYLDTLSKEFAYAVEVRHLDLFKYDHAEEHLNSILFERSIDRVIFDSRGIYEAVDDPTYPSMTETRKPRLPVHYETTGPKPMVRLISHPTLAQNRERWEQWAKILVDWIDQGQEPYFFMHVPDNKDAPHFARVFHELMMREDDQLGPLPKWPIERIPEGGEQISLF